MTPKSSQPAWKLNAFNRNVFIFLSDIMHACNALTKKCIFQLLFIHNVYYLSVRTSEITLASILSTAAFTMSHAECVSFHNPAVRVIYPSYIPRLLSSHQNISIVSYFVTIRSLWVKLLICYAEPAVRYIPLTYRTASSPCR